MTIPASSTRLSGIALTPTDIELFRWLWMLRVMTLGQLRRVGYYQSDTGRLSSLHNVRKRLRRLWTAGYLSGDTLLETRERYYQLAEPALPALYETYGIEQRRLYKPRGLETMRHVHHTLMVSECAVRVAESLRESEITLLDLLPLRVPFYHTHTVGDVRKKKHVNRFVTQEDLLLRGRTSPLRIRPDLVFALTQREISRLYFLEADRGSESPQEISAKQLAYHHYATAPAFPPTPTASAPDPENLFQQPQPQPQYRWQRYGAVQSFRVLFVTTDDRRLTKLTQALQEKPGFELMAFTTIAALQQQNMIFGPIWTNQHGPDRALARRLPTS